MIAACAMAGAGLFVIYVQVLAAEASVTSAMEPEYLQRSAIRAMDRDILMMGARAVFPARGRVGLLSAVLLAGELAAVIAVRHAVEPEYQNACLVEEKEKHVMENDNLILRLEIVSDHCCADNLKPMGATVKEAIEQLRKMDAMRELLNYIVAPKKKVEPEIDICQNCAASSRTCKFYDFKYLPHNKILVLECGDYDPMESALESYNDKAQKNKLLLS